jgi:hypothetical protein
LRRFFIFQAIFRSYNFYRETVMRKRTFGFFIPFFSLLAWSVFAQKMTVKDSDANILMEVNDEGAVGSITVPSGSAPSITTNKLYNVGGSLYWNGSALGAAGSASGWTDGGANVYTTTAADKVGIGTTAPEFKLTLFDAGILALGSGDPDLTLSTTGSGTKFIWYPQKAAFRAGAVTGDQWDDVKIGRYSIALGCLTTASGVFSTAMGISTTASGPYCTAMGNGTTASGDDDMAMGFSTTASGGYSTAMGKNTTASSLASTVMGQYNIGGGTAYNWIDTDPIFEIGIGADDAHKANAVTVLKNGHVGVGIATPGQKLEINGKTLTSQLQVGTSATAGHVLTADASGNATWQAASGGGGGWTDGGANMYTTTSTDKVGIGTSIPEFKLSVIDDGGILAMGTFGAGASLVTSGAGTRLIWYPNKAAFRAGSVNGTQWDDANVGAHSMAVGNNTTASGNTSTASGASTIASGTVSTAMGYGTTASSYATVAIGKYNIGGGGANSWNATDPLFEIGIGADASNKANALTVLKNGNMGIGIATPGQKLEVSGKTLTSQLQVGTSATAGHVLTADASGNATWQAASGGGGGWTDDGTVVRLTTSTDKVGIGDSSPTYTLDVAGKIGINDTQILYLPDQTNFNGTLIISNGGESLSHTTNYTGMSNTAIGINALYHNTTGYNNTAIGTDALLINTTGFENTAVGADALIANITTGAYNTAVGHQALYSNTTGSFNTALGNHALSINTTGSSNTAVGYVANVSSGNLNNATAIGYGATVNASNKVVIGNSSVTSIGGYADWTNYSDKRYKENIVNNNTLGLDFIMKLNTVLFNYKDDENKRRRDGLIAQDVQAALNELGVEFSGLVIDDDPQGTMNLSYGSFVLPLINAVKEQQKEIEALKTELRALRK